MSMVMPATPPTIELVIGPDGQPEYQVCGLGMCSRHRQRWQAQVHWECMTAAKGGAGVMPFIDPDPVPESGT